MTEAVRTDPTHPPIAAPRAADLAAALGGAAPYLVGIGGSGTSALARLLHAGGLRVRGSDAVASPVTRALSAANVTVDDEQAAGALPEDTAVVIASAAVRPDNPQVLEAERRGLVVLSYAEALGRCMRVRTGVSVAGTHGKSTTTAMLGCCLTDAGLDPSVIVGATCNQLAAGCLGAGGAAASDRHRGFRLGAERIAAGPLAGRPGLLVAEACEYNRSFHHHRPLLGTIAGVEADHLDVYGSLDAVVEAFAGFAALIPAEADGGRLIIGHDGAHRRQIVAGLSCRVDTIGFAPGADWRVSTGPGARVELRGPDGAACAWTMSMPGEHNAMNSAVAAASAIVLGADPGRVGRSLSAFRGLDRRLQCLGDRAVSGGSVRVYDDYGHHPTEIDATLRALRRAEAPQDRGGRLIVVFQPHQHSRTRFLLDEFATSFGQADVVIVPHIYFVRDSETEKQRVSSADLVDRLRRRGVRAMHLYPFEAIVEQLENLCRADDLLVVMGAGPVWQVAEGFMASAEPVAAPSVAPGRRAGPAAEPGVVIDHDAPIPTWFRVGGAARRMARPASPAALAEALALDPEAKILGDGANLLVDDGGVEGLVIDLSADTFRDIRIDRDAMAITAGAGVRLPGLIGKAARAALAGLEVLAGIPASVGGAVVMNAGGRHGQIADVVAEVRGLTRDGRPFAGRRDAIDFGYRASGLAGVVVTEVVFRLEAGDPGAIRARAKQIQDAKAAEQPLADRSAGCCFKNPTLAADLPGVGAAGERVAAGLLIDRAGCKGLRVGSAEVSSRHANFITVDRGGRARDVIELMDLVAARVRQAFGIELDREVVVWGRPA